MEKFPINVIEGGIIFFIPSKIPFLLLQMTRTLSKSNTGSIKKSPDGSIASSPDITSRGPINNNNHISSNNNGGTVNGNGNGPAMSETSDDSSLNSVDLDPMGESRDDE